MKCDVVLAAGLAVLAPVATTLPAAEAHSAVVNYQSPQAAADALLAADRGFSAAAADKDMVSGIVAMLRPDAVMPSRVAGFSKGPEAIAAALRSYPDLAGAKASWEPVRAGVSADGLHGFTYGFMTIRREGKPAERAKYLSYWTNAEDGWKVALFKRGRSGDGEVSSAVRPAALPPSILTPDPAAVPAHRASLVAAEKAFSDDAQTIGLGPAFVKNGSSDAMNMGGGADFTFGNEVIGADLSRQGPPGATVPIYWAADEGVLVASSGDLGVTWGWIRQHKPTAGQPDKFPFFTIWRRGAPDQPWRYVAE